MEKFVDKIAAKHGIFQFCYYDQFVGSSLKKYGEFSEIELSFMQKFINYGDIVFDIGANIGAFSIPFSKKVGIHGQVFSFEPQRFINKILGNNKSLNNLKNIKIFNSGVGNKEFFLELNEIDYSEHGNFGGIGLKEYYDNSLAAKVINNKKYKVKIIKLDKFLNLDKCDFVKIDVELMELDVLCGGKNFIEKFRPIMWIENHQVYPNEVNNFLLKNDYDCYWMVTKSFNESNYFINDINYYGETYTTNTLAIPIERQKGDIEESLEAYKIKDGFSKPIIKFDSTC